jgi:sRNA-binding protein
MKRLVFVVLGALAVAPFGVMLYNTWGGARGPLVKAPGEVEQGRMDLHAKLVQAEQREGEIEKVYWNSPAQLQVLVKSHQQRIDELKGNDAGAEIVAHDKDAIERLQKRIADVEAEREAEAKAKAEEAKAEAQAKKAEAQQKRSDQH